jgi:hypothetical protein
VLEDLADHIHLIDKRHHPHLSVAFRAYQGIGLINLVYQPRPGPTRTPGGQPGLKDTRYGIIRV